MRLSHAAAPQPVKATTAAAGKGSYLALEDAYVHMDKKNAETEKSLRLTQSKNEYQSSEWMDRQEEQLIMILCAYFKK